MPKHQMIRDPLVIKTLVQQRPDLPLALGLDLATNCGVAQAFFDPAEGGNTLHKIWLGQWDLSAAGYESGGARFMRLRQMLYETNPSVIFYEDVKVTPVQMPGPPNPGAIVARVAPSLELIGAFKSHVCEYGERQGIPVVGLGIGEIKRYATGRGNADKVAVIKAANAKFGIELDSEHYQTTGDDNIADAAFVLTLGLSLYGHGAAI
jgi:hypothetical protein